MGFLTDAIDSLGEDSDDTPAGPTYFSSGGDPVTVTDEWRRFDFGFVASATSLRADGPVLVAFQRPYGRPDKHIPLDVDETPLTWGDDGDPVNSPSMWVRAADSASGTVDVHAEAQPR